MKQKGLVVVSNYYKSISDNLLKYCLKTLNTNKLEADVKFVSGALEIPTLISCNIKKKYKFFIGLGCIIKGENSSF